MFLNPEMKKLNAEEKTSRDKKKIAFGAVKKLKITRVPTEPIAAPERSEAYAARDQLAVIYENEIGDLTQAIMQYDKILEADNLENRLEIQYRRASDYFKQADYDRAWRELRRIEDSGEAGLHLADQVYLKLGSIDQMRRRYEDAADYFRKVINSPCPECRRRAILNLTETYEALYDFDNAIETIRKLDHSVTTAWTSTCARASSRSASTPMAAPLAPEMPTTTGALTLTPSRRGSPHHVPGWHP